MRLNLNNKSTLHSQILFNPLVWIAQNMNSVQLAEKLGYEYDHEYIAYEVANDLRTH